VTIPAGGYELIIRPCTDQYKQMLKTTPIFLIGIVVFFSLREGVASLILATVTAVVCLVIVYFYFRGVHVVVTENEIGRSGFTSRRRMRPRGDIGTVVTATVPLSVVDTRTADNLFVLDHAGRRIIRLRSTHWSHDDMARVIDRLGIQPVGYGEVVSAKRLSRDFPKALPLIERRPWLISVAMVVAIVVLAMAAVLIFA
jgi:hypothetical protein